MKQCPTGALSIVEDKIVRNKNLCKKCCACVETCYSGAHRVIGKSVAIAELYEQIEEDRNIFEQTGGGITLSGGEPMLQFPFIEEFIRMLSEKGYHIVLQTNLSVRWKLYEGIIPFVNHFMCDLKLLDTELHHYWTRKDNRLILDNICKLDSSGVSYRLRTPVIPGVNDSKEQLSAMSVYARKMKNIECYELLPFHPLASYKYKQLGMVYTFENVKPIQSEKFTELKKTFEFYNQ
jgi:pyruvate formate lyase activating enzyme